MSGFIFFYSFLHNAFGAYFWLTTGHTVAAGKQERYSLGSIGMEFATGNEYIYIFVTYSTCFR